MLGLVGSPVKRRKLEVEWENGAIAEYGEVPGCFRVHHGREESEEVGHGEISSILEGVMETVQHASTASRGKKGRGRPRKQRQEEAAPVAERSAEDEDMGGSGWFIKANGMILETEGNHHHPSSTPVRNGLLLGASDEVQLEKASVVGREGMQTSCSKRFKFSEKSAEEAAGGFKLGTPHAGINERIQSKADKIVQGNSLISCLEDPKGEECESTGNFESKLDEISGNGPSFSTPVEEEQGSKKRRRLSETPNLTSNTTVRRSARRAAAVAALLASANPVPSIDGVDDSSAAKVEEKEVKPEPLPEPADSTFNTPVRRSARRKAAASAALLASTDAVPSTDEVGDASPTPVEEEIKLELPPSSKDLDLDGLNVLDVFSVYSYLRAFSTLLFLSPFTLETFIRALRCDSVSPLIDSVHFSLLRALKPHLENLSAEGNRSATKCLGCIDWELLDTVTWPVYLAEYLLLRRPPMKSCYNLSSLKLLDGEYYKQPASVKLEILRCICDDVIEIQLVRSDIYKRMRDTDPMADIDQGSLIPQTQKIDSNADDLPPSVPSDNGIVEAADNNSDECCLCKMDGALICCDGCPAAFHARCVGVSKEKLPEGEWHCPECSIGEVDQPRKHRKPLQGAELLGVDPDGRLYFASCGYLLVSDYDSADASYYSKHDLTLVIHSLVNLPPNKFTDVVRAITSYWGVYWDSSRYVFEVDNKVHGEMELDHESSSPDTLPSKRKKGTSREKKSSLACPKNVMEDRGITAESDKELTYSSCADFAQDSKCLAVESAGIDTQEECKACFRNDAVDLTLNQSEGLESQVVLEQNDYINNYSFGRVAASIAQDLIGKPLEGTNRDFIASIDDLKSVQLKTIFDSVSKLGWSTVQKLSLDLMRESCGWCFCCKNLDNQECLFNIVENKLLEGSKNLPLGIRSAKLKGSHFLHAIHQLLSIEDNLNGLLEGPWENPLYRKHWNKCVRKASDVDLLKKFTLTLELNLRRIALSADWLRSTDSDLTVGSSSLVPTCLTIGSSKEGSCKKRGRKSKSEAQKNNLEANALSSHAGNTSDFCWWRGGRLSRQLFHWKVLPRSLTTKTARQAGCQKIPGVFYPDGFELGKRSQYLAWRAAVEMSKSVSELHCHIKELDKNIKWKDLKNIQLPVNDLKKQAKHLKNVTVQSKIVEGGQVNYVVDFGRKKTIPESITRHALMFQETSSGRKKYWLNESNVPLRLVKVYEVKKLSQIATNCKLDKKLPFVEGNTGKLTKPIRQRGFAYLFSRHQKLDSQRCGDCNEVVLNRDAVSCHFCNGVFHRKHFRVPKGATMVIYACSACNEKENPADTIPKKVQTGERKREKPRKNQRPVAARSRKVSTNDEQEVQAERDNRRTANQLLKGKEKVSRVENPDINEEEEVQSERDNRRTANQMHKRKEKVSIVENPDTNDEQELQPGRDNRRTANQMHKRKQKASRVENPDKKRKIWTEVNGSRTALKLRRSSKRIAARSKYLIKSSLRKSKLLLKSSLKQVNKTNKVRTTKVNKTKAVRRTMMNKIKEVSKPKSRSALNLEDAISGIRWYTGKRTAAHHSYWLNGLLWARRQDVDQGLSFRSKKVLMPSATLNGLIGAPVCLLCNQEYRPELIYIGCEACGDWFHAAAFSVTPENISNLTGFKCHKCRVSNGPECPYFRNGCAVDIQKLKHNFEGRVYTRSVRRSKRPPIIDDSSPSIQHSDSVVVHNIRYSTRANEKMATPSMTSDILPGNCNSLSPEDKHMTSNAGQKISNTFSLPDVDKPKNIEITKNDFTRGHDATICSRDGICEEQRHANSCGERSCEESNNDVSGTCCPLFKGSRHAFLESDKQDSKKHDTVIRASNSTNKQHEDGYKCSESRCNDENVSRASNITSESVDPFESQSSLNEDDLESEMKLYASLDSMEGAMKTT